jgi:Cysteine dioxygenase type I
MSLTLPPAPPAPGRAAPPGPAQLARVARAVAASPELWRPLVRFTAGRRWYARIDLAGPGPGCELWLLSWLPGQETGFHDHGGAAGAFAVADGTLTERTGQAGQRRVRARLLGTGAARAFGPEHLHDVGNAGTRPAVSVHAYAPALAMMRRYEMTGAGLVLRATEPAGGSW